MSEGMNDTIFAETGRSTRSDRSSKRPVLGGGGRSSAFRRFSSRSLQSTGVSRQYLLPLIPTSRIRPRISPYFKRSTPAFAANPQVHPTTLGTSPGRISSRVVRLHYALLLMILSPSPAYTTYWSDECLVDFESAGILGTQSSRTYGNRCPRPYTTRPRRSIQHSTTNPPLVRARKHAW